MQVIMLMHFSWIMLRGVMQILTFLALLVTMLKNVTQKMSIWISNVKQKFKFIFDFGDEWRFECQVLREIETEDEEAYLVRSIGTPPEQYPDYDGFDCEEW